MSKNLTAVINNEQLLIDNLVLQTFRNFHSTISFLKSEFVEVALKLSIEAWTEVIQNCFQLPT